ncbi:GrpB family protein [Filobacillus milosensis]|uniref:GrpB family protein n=1 Tax=Filobacillus milosensis TaxID=94137 RepID=A0A4Y8IFQ4_9BACI|nr:GrpB family protein [Filobacillus milosensis]TFB19493.1 GrpB family protein [Filobacillus milosensis]
MLGLKKGEVKLVPHNPEWSQLFKKEKQLLEETVGEHIVAIEHFGSTAIKGIKAKPIIDILVGVRELDNARDLEVRTMSEIDYFRLQKQTVKDKVIFAKFPYREDDNFTKTHYLHVVEYGGDWWNAHVTFRDRLNEHAELAKEYESLKLSLAEKYADDVIAYLDAKESFVKKVIE